MDEVVQGELNSSNKPGEGHFTEPEGEKSWLLSVWKLRQYAS